MGDFTLIRSFSSDLASERRLWKKKPAPDLESLKQLSVWGRVIVKTTSWDNNGLTRRVMTEESSMYGEGRNLGHFQKKRKRESSGRSSGGRDNSLNVADLQSGEPK